MSFQIRISPKERAEARFVSRVREEIVRAYTEEAEARGLTQAQVADLMGVGKRNRSIISRIFNGKANITLKTIGALAYALDRRPRLVLDRVPEPAAGTNAAPAAGTNLQSRSTFAPVVEDLGSRSLSRQGITVVRDRADPVAP